MKPGQDKLKLSGQTLRLAVMLFALSCQLFQALPANADDRKFSGKVSWYGPGFEGKKTASGEMFTSAKPTAAHRSLAFGTRVLIENPRTGLTTVVKVNDRGPFVKGRVMDLSKEGARQSGVLSMGVAYVDCLVLDGGKK